ncbi:sensor histidine kinase [Flagellimonas meridianipacifica]|uniref:Histidine kinase n=1 Tax=Flagellimonas meridianipacifica TaxID=1080225 RepID=A0A2T0MBG5_9FLAO|nr:histidine kinase [Allomuricauda pacifica]PRX54837.1 histidine kinase [Allomuricauda pacifica]
MKFFNKARRIKYLGFNDAWFVAVGIILLSFVTDFMFSRNSFARLPFFEATINWSVSLMFATTNWLIIRSILIVLRKKYPSLKDNKIRIPLFFLTIVLTVMIVDYMGNMLLGYIFNQSYNHPLRSRIVLPIILISTMTMAIYEAVYYYVLLKNSIREEEQAKRAIVQSQLDTLRNQAQPHFLFNTLNTLRDIIDQNTREEAKEFVNRLSEVFRFILEAGNANLIELREELKFAEAYIHIQKERFGDNLQLDWQVPEPAKNKMIIPMSLQLLLENAVKHNVISKSKPLVITVEAENGHLIVSNKIRPKSTQLPTTKLGLKNIESRYRLIANKEVEIHKENGSFTVKLPLLTATDQKHAYANPDY